MTAGGDDPRRTDTQTRRIQARISAPVRLVRSVELVKLRRLAGQVLQAQERYFKTPRDRPETKRQALTASKRLEGLLREQIDQPAPESLDVGPVVDAIDALVEAFESNDRPGTVLALQTLLRQRTRLIPFR